MRTVEEAIVSWLPAAHSLADKVSYGVDEDARSEASLAVVLACQGGTPDVERHVLRAIWRYHSRQRRHRQKLMCSTVDTPERTRPDACTFLDVQDAIGRLHPADQALARQYFYRGLSMREVARAWGTSSSWVRARLTTIRKDLCRRLTGYAGAEA
jgi:hypothetical protein